MLLKRREVETDCLYPSRAWTKNEGRYNCTPTIYIHGVFKNRLTFSLNVNSK